VHRAWTWSGACAHERRQYRPDQPCRPSVIGFSGACDPPASKIEHGLQYATRVGGLPLSLRQAVDAGPSMQHPCPSGGSGHRCGGIPGDIRGSSRASRHCVRANDESGRVDEQTPYDTSCKDTACLGRRPHSNEKMIRLHQTTLNTEDSPDHTNYARNPEMKGEIQGQQYTTRFGARCDQWPE
jgi:hypothetical protein